MPLRTAPIRSKYCRPEAKHNTNMSGDLETRPKVVARGGRTALSANEGQSARQFCTVSSGFAADAPISSLWSKGYVAQQKASAGERQARSVLCRNQGPQGNPAGGS